MSDVRAADRLEKDADARTRTFPRAGFALAGLVELGGLGGLSAYPGLGTTGWLTGLAFTVGAGATLVATFRRAGKRTLTPADWITLLRLTLIGWVTAIAIDRIGQTAPLLMAVIAAVALVLDGVDGKVARRTDTASDFGARFDMEVDAVLLLVLSVFVSVLLGPWVLAIGGMRYAYVVASWGLPWLRIPLPPKYIRKVIAVVQGVVLVVASVDLVPAAVEVGALLVALGLLSWSFGRDVLWQWRQRRRVPAIGPDRATDSAPDDGPQAGGSAKSRVLVWGTTALAGLVVFVGLVLPNNLLLLHPQAFVRIPLEAVVGAVVLLVLPPRPRVVVATVVGVSLALVTLLKLLDMGFHAVLGRSFDPVLDWVLLPNAVEFLSGSFGWVGAVAGVLGAGLLAIGLPVVMAFSVVRLAKQMRGHRRVAIQAALVVGVAWVLCLALGVKVSGARVASTGISTYVRDRVAWMYATVQDQQTFAAEVGVDAFGHVPGDQLLSALRGKDVIFAFIESYGRIAIEDSQMAPLVDAVLDDGTRRLREAGFQTRSAFLTSPITGAGSWLAHSSFMSGLWITNQQRYRTVMHRERLTLVGAFRRTNHWRTVGVMPGTRRAWPEGRFYRFDQVYDAHDLGYRGPEFGWSPIPDQYALAAFERLEHGRADREPLAVEIVLTSSHSPWVPLPEMVGWNELGDGSIYRAIHKAGKDPEWVWKDADRVRVEYARAIAYSLRSLISYVEEYGDDDTVVVVLGDHQPSPVVTRNERNHDVPISIIARDPAVLDRIADWGWRPGLRPDAHAPAWRMDSFRNRFLTAYSPHLTG
ncbi:MAG TPA: CDP-alcohol phosphatidyltransferase family protein [Actinopolymorphaceae bacterium]|jgi:phosphatidylglycerophosphate synthase